MCATMSYQTTFMHPLITFLLASLCCLFHEDLAKDARSAQYFGRSLPLYIDIIGFEGGVFNEKARS